MSATKRLQQHTRGEADLSQRGVDCRRLQVARLRGAGMELSVKSLDGDKVPEGALLGESSSK